MRPRCDWLNLSSPDALWTAAWEKGPVDAKLCVPAGPCLTNACRKRHVAKTSFCDALRLTNVSWRNHEVRRRNKFCVTFEGCRKTLSQGQNGDGQQVLGPVLLSRRVARRNFLRHDGVCATSQLNASY